MKIRKYLLAMCSLIMIACDNDENVMVYTTN